MRSTIFAALTAPLVALIAFLTPIQAGTLIVSGDSTPIYSLMAAPPGFGVSAGNQRFFQNVLGAGDAVTILDSSFGAAPQEAHAYFSSLAGVSSTLVAGQLTASHLVDADLLIAAIPSAPFWKPARLAIADFLNNGGTVFLLGEAEAESIPFGGQTNGYINTLLSAMGSDLSLVTNVLDIGTQDATGAQIAPHPLTAGVTAYTYGATSEVVGGAPLYFTKGGVSFTAVESLTVPEPTSAMIACLGAAILAWRRKLSFA
jgi:hypothetical protein